MLKGMPSIVDQAPPVSPQLDHTQTQIGPSTRLGLSELRALLDDLATRPLPRDERVVAALREVAKGALGELPAGHPLVGADLDGAGAPLLVRLLSRVVRDLGATRPSGQPRP